LGNWSINEPFNYDGKWWFGAIYVRERRPDEDIPDLFGGILPVRKAHLCADLDIAVLTLDLPLNTKTGEFVRPLCMRLSPGLPEIGQPCIGLGYHKMKSLPSEAPDIFKLFQSYSATRGVVKEVYFPSRDARILPFPSFFTTARFDGGMSGGPIMNEHGCVIGVICSSFGADEDGEHTSFGSLIGPALLIAVEAKLVSGDAGSMFLHDFVLSGSVGVDSSSARLRYLREGQRLTIDFGVQPPISNILK
jgi:hypothetical protein